MGNKLYVGNLAYSVRDDSLLQAFSQFGTVTSAKVMMDRETGRSKGFGFVEMGSDPEAQAAINGMNGQPIDGRAVVVNEAVPVKSARAASAVAVVAAAAVAAATVVVAAVATAAAVVPAVAVAAAPTAVVAAAAVVAAPTVVVVAAVAAAVVVAAATVAAAAAAAATEPTRSALASKSRRTSSSKGTFGCLLHGRTTCGTPFARRLSARGDQYRSGRSTCTG